jgi:Protein of unknown function (DUF2721)
MDLEMIARTIQLIIAPAVMITSCCIFGAGLLTHYAGIGERLRLSVRERVDLLREMSADKNAHTIAKERLEDLDDQIPQLLRHHWLMRTSLAAVLFGMIFYILDMFVIAFSVIANRASLYSLILVVFMPGVTSQLVGVIYAVVDAFMSHRIYAFETRHVLFLEKSEKNL